MTIINTLTDLKTLIDNGDYGVESNWSDVVDRVASIIAFRMEDCPPYGDDWSDFLATLNMTELVIQADDELMAEAADALEIAHDLKAGIVREEAEY